MTQPSNESRPNSGRKIPPQSARALVEEGHQLASTGKKQAAFARFQTAVAQRAGFAPAMLGMAEIHLQSGQTSAARMVLKSVDQWTEDGPSLSRAAGLLLQLRCEEEAERAATRALAAKGTNRATIHRIRGEARRILRRLKEALVDFEKSARGGDEFAMVRRSTVLRELNQLDEAQKHCPDPHTFRLPAAKAAAWHERATLADQVGDASTAFEGWSKAGALESELPEWRRLDRTLWLRQVHVWTEWCQTHAQNSPAPQTNSDETTPSSPHFLVGFSRTGTTLLERMLSGHSSIATSGEAPLVTTVRQHLLQGQPIERLPHLVPDGTSPKAEQLRGLFDRTAESLVPEAAKAPCFVHKQPMNIIDLPMILQLWPKALIIRTIRDPRDVVLSCFSQHFSANGINRHFLDIESTANMVAKVQALNEAVDARFPDANIVDVRYESFVADPESTLRAILERLGLDFEPEVFDPTRDTSIQQTPSFLEAKKMVHSNRTERWRRYEPHLRSPCQILDEWIQKSGWPPWDKDVNATRQETT